jgi:serine/threonine protein kinase
MDDQLADRSGEQVEKFKLDRLLGEGGMGQVYLAQHQVTDRWVAVKILHAEYAQNEEILARIRREAKASALIGHPNIVEIIDSGVDSQGAPFIAMELLEGESLDEYLERKGPISVELACYIVADILDTLTAAHESGVIHRDMKPENVYLQKKHKSIVPKVKILDFGISKFLTLDKQNMSLTRTGTVMGTPYYMSVEQAMGQKVDGRADIYSVGVILYQLLTARLPYYDTNYNRVLLQIVAGEHIPVIDIRPDLPQMLSDIVQYTMAKNRDERYPDCQSLKDALDPFWNSSIPEEFFFEGEGGETYSNTNPIPLKTPTPQMSDPRLITDALSRTGQNLNPMSTVTTGEVVLQPHPKSKMMMLMVVGIVIVGLTGLAWFFMNGKSKDNTKDYVAQTGNHTKPKTDMVPEKQPPPMVAIMKPVVPPMVEPKLLKFVVLKFKNLPRRGCVVRLNDNRIKFPYKVDGAKGIHSLTVTHRKYQKFTQEIELNKKEIVIEYKKTRKYHYSNMKTSNNTKPTTTMRPVMKKPDMNSVILGKPDF